MPSLAVSQGNFLWLHVLLKRIGHECVKNALQAKHVKVHSEDWAPMPYVTSQHLSVIFLLNVPHFSLAFYHAKFRI